jgi:hypothetical protein
MVSAHFSSEPRKWSWWLEGDPRCLQRTPGCPSRALWRCPQRPFWDPASRTPPPGSLLWGSSPRNPPQDSSSRIPPPGFHAKIPPQGFLIQDFSSRSPPGFLLQDSSSGIPPPGFLLQDSSSKVPLSGFLFQDSSSGIPVLVFSSEIPLGFLLWDSSSSILFWDSSDMRPSPGFLIQDSPVVKSPSQVLLLSTVWGLTLESYMNLFIVVDSQKGVFPTYDAGEGFLWTGHCCMCLSVSSTAVRRRMQLKEEIVAGKYCI